MALPAGRKGVLPSELTPEGKIRNSASPYVLPTASAETLGGVKVGSGLTIEDGVLSASGGGGITIKKHEMAVSLNMSNNQVKANHDNVALNAIPANAVIIGSKIVTTSGDARYVQPLLGTNPDGSVHVGYWNTEATSVTFSGKLVIYYYEEA